MLHGARLRLSAMTGIALIVAACGQDVPGNPTGPLPVDGPSPSWSWPGSHVVVKPSSMNGECQTLSVPVYCYSQYPSGWLFYNDESDEGDPSLGSFVDGPTDPPGPGTGSVQISVSGTQRRNLATFAFADTRLMDITDLKFTTYNPSAGNGGSASRSGYLNINIDFDSSDSWQRRLIFLPSDNGAVLQNTWQEWDAVSAGAALWRYSGGTWPVTGGSGTKTWAQILSDYPGVRIRVTDAHVAIRVGEPYSDGYTENIGSFAFGTAAGVTVYDFEPEFGPCNVAVSGSKYTLLDDCATHHTLLVPDGFTLDGSGFTVTAHDPPGGHFLGAVIMNGGTTASVVNTVVTAENLVNVCDGSNPDYRLRGILFNGAGGTISGNQVLGINQGNSGCQEGNGIEVRNAPFDGTHPATKSVTIEHNVVRAYQKTGIVTNGDVQATIAHNEVGSAGLDDYIAANSIQVGFGAHAAVNNNVIEGNDWDGASYYVATAVLIYAAGDVSVNSNLIGTLGEDEQTDIGVYAEASGTVNVMRNVIRRASEDESAKPCFSSLVRPDPKCDPDGVGIYFWGNSGKSKAVRNSFEGWTTSFVGADLEKRNVVITP